MLKIFEFTRKFAFPSKGCVLKALHLPVNLLFERKSYVSHFALVLLIRDKMGFIPKQYVLETRRAHSQCSLKCAL